MTYLLQTQTRPSEPWQSSSAKFRDEAHALVEARNWYDQHHGSLAVRIVRDSITIAEFEAGRFTAQRRTLFGWRTIDTFETFEAASTIAIEAYRSFETSSRVLSMTGDIVGTWVNPRETLWKKAKALF